MTEKAQHTFETALIVLVLLILPALPLGKYGGGVAMMAVSLVGLAFYFALYGARLRSRGQLKWPILAMIIGAVVSAVLVLSMFGRGSP